MGAILASGIFLICVISTVKAVLDRRAKLARIRERRNGQLPEKDLTRNKDAWGKEPKYIYHRSFSLGGKGPVILDPATLPDSFQDSYSVEADDRSPDDIKQEWCDFVVTRENGADDNTSFEHLDLDSPSESLDWYSELYKRKCSCTDGIKIELANDVFGVKCESETVETSKCQSDDNESSKTTDTEKHSNDGATDNSPPIADDTKLERGENTNISIEHTESESNENSDFSIDSTNIKDQEENNLKKSISSIKAKPEIPPEIIQETELIPSPVLYECPDSSTEPLIEKNNPQNNEQAIENCYISNVDIITYL